MSTGNALLRSEHVVARLETIGKGGSHGRVSKKRGRWDKDRRRSEGASH